MELEEGFERRRQRKVRVKVRTNRGLEFMTAIRADASISDLANRALSVYLQLSEDGRLPGVKKQLTVSAVKQGIFYMPKSELVSNLLNNDDEVEVVIIKAKPKYPNQIFQNNQPSVTAAKPLAPNPQPPLNDVKQTQLNAVVPIEEEKEPGDNLSSISKRQKKMQKRQQKKKIKHQARQKQAIQRQQQKHQEKKKEKEPPREYHLQKSQTKNQIVSEVKTTKEGDFNQDGGPRKRLKFDKQKEKQQIAEKVPPLIVPSPKITFHNEPRLQSPKFFLLADSSKKKWEGQIRKPSEDIEKRSQLEKIISPIRSPLIYQRSPNMALLDSSKIKDKDELSGFTLSFRKLSQDKKIQGKKEKTKDEVQSPRKEDVKASTKKDEEKEPMLVQPQAQQTGSKLQVQKKEEKKVEPVKPKVIPSMIVVEQDDSDSQENKKSNGYAHHRQKQLSEIQQKINEFYIHSDEE